MAATPNIPMDGHMDDIVQYQLFHRNRKSQTDKQTLSEMPESCMDTSTNTTDLVQPIKDLTAPITDLTSPTEQITPPTEQITPPTKHTHFNVPHKIGHGYTHMALCSYFIALRPWSLIISLPPVALGCSLAYKTNSEFDISIFCIVCFTALCVHAAGNLVNTYCDYNKGVDTQGKSDDRTLVDSIISQSDVVTMGAAFYFLGCVGFMVLNYFSPARMELLALVYFGGLSGSFLYTGGLGLKYIALGDLVVFLIFGPVTVLFAYVAQAGTLSWVPLVYAVPLALNTEAILHSNNTRDIVGDAKAGVVTLAIILGHTGSYILFTFLLFTPYIVFALLTVHWSVWFLLPLVTILPAFQYEKLFRLQQLKKMPQNLAMLNLQLGVLYIFACLMTTPDKLPGFQQK